MSKPVLTESRICFGIDYYATEAEADEAGQRVRDLGLYYNGGYFHGKLCGREPSRDYDHPTLGRIYAVTS